MVAERRTTLRVCRGKECVAGKNATARAGIARFAPGCTAITNTEGVPCIGLPKVRGGCIVGLTRQSPGQLGGRFSHCSGVLAIAARQILHGARPIYGNGCDSVGH
jgi:hypothetical protein